ncbi:hypothetical protein [Rahnella sp. PCH160]|uniref:hypothetical protein n=1 Tax=Rahnella sp. PCH160 TaxID=3447928 RepID=UPI0039FBCA62
MLTRADQSEKRGAGWSDPPNNSQSFVSTMRIFYDTVIMRGACVIGSCPREGYKFCFPVALLENDEFLGLLLDEENQYDLTEKRIDGWLEKIKQAVL